SKRDWSSDVCSSDLPPASMLVELLMNGKVPAVDHHLARTGRREVPTPPGRGGRTISGEELFRARAVQPPDGSGAGDPGMGCGSRAARLRSSAGERRESFRVRGTLHSLGAPPGAGTRDRHCAEHALAAGAGAAGP